MALFAEVARLAEELASEASRLKKRAAIAAALRRVAGQPMSQMRDMGHPDPGLENHGQTRSAFADAGLFCLYLAGQPFAEADARKLNAGGALLTRVLKAISGCTEAALSAAYRRHGDLGAAAYDLLVAPYGHAPAESVLTLDEVAAAFDAMAGARSTAARAATVEGLLRRATALEAKYLLKLMLGDMRIGVKQSLIEEAIALAAAAAVVTVRHAVMLEADLARAAEMAFAGTLDEARMRLFHPLGFMLASPVETPEEAVERFTQKPQKVKPKITSKPRKNAASGEAPEAVVPVDAAEEGYAEDVIAATNVDPSTPLWNDNQERLRNDNPENKAGVVEAFLEDKYDGMRAQVHCGWAAPVGGKRMARVAIYSRNREDITQSFPEIEEAFHAAMAAAAAADSGEGTERGGLILDGEMLGWDFASDRAEGKALPFAVLGQRIGRKRVDAAMRRQIPVVFMAFDLLFEGGELLLARPLRKRRARLEALVERLGPLATAPLEPDESTDGDQGSLFGGPDTTAEHLPRLMLSPATLVASAQAIDTAYADARARANEGVMLKAADSAYVPGRRGLAWVKLKRELATLDVVITGAEFGHGRRAGLLSDYTFAVRRAGHRGQAAELLNVGKAYSGVTDAEIAELTEWLKAHTLDDHGHFRTVEPLRVIEVAFNNVMRSDRHASGFALRFPRILRIRDDKPVEEIDTLERVEEIYQGQPDRPAASDDGE